LVGIKTDTTNAIWKDIFHARHTYGLRFSIYIDEVRGYYTHDHHSLLKDIPTPRLAIARAKNTVCFSVHGYLFTPKVSAELSLPRECHLSGSTSFTFTIEYSKNSTQPITTDKSRSHMSRFEGDLNPVKQLLDCGKDI
jgi:hypothetical protein